MKTIPKTAVEEVWNRQCDLEEEPSQSLARQFFDEQPALALYLAGAEETSEDQEDSDESSLIPLAMAVWSVMREARDGALPGVEPGDIEAAEEANLRMLTELDEASELERQNAIQGLVRGYNQSALLEFCLEVLMSGHEDAPDLAPERIGMDLITLKTLIDCLDGR